LYAELRNDESVSKTIDTSLDSLNLRDRQDFLGLKQDLQQTNQNIKALSDSVERSASASAKSPAPVAAPVAPAPTPAPATLKGYISVVNENGVIINLGSDAGVQVGAQFSVFKVSDPQTEFGVVEVTELIDANNSRAKSVYCKPGMQFEFGDIVRLK
jgi:hypothetical protein